MTREHWGLLAKAGGVPRGLTASLLSVLGPSLLFPTLLPSCRAAGQGSSGRGEPLSTLSRQDLLDASSVFHGPGRLAQELPAWLTVTLANACLWHFLAQRVVCSAAFVRPLRTHQCVQLPRTSVPRLGCCFPVSAAQWARQRGDGTISDSALGQEATLPRGWEKVLSHQ